MKRLFIILLILGMWFITDVKVESFEDLTWENISGEIGEVNVVWVDNQDSQIILAGTNQGVFMTEDGGSSWQAVLFGVDKKINFLYVEKTNKDLIYAGSSCGLFFSRNQGKTWQRIYQGDDEEENNCLSFTKLKAKELYLGTQTGLLTSQNNGRIWHRFSGRLGNLPIQAIAVDQTNKHIYLATPEGVYRVKPQAGAERIFIFAGADLEETDEESEHQIKHLCIDPDKPQEIYLATTQGVFISKDQGNTWAGFPDFGLLSKEVRFITVSPGSVLWAVTKSGVFAFDKDRWQELSLRLTMQDIRFLSIDDYGNIYVGGDKGLFKSADYQRFIYSVRNQVSNGVHALVDVNQEPTIQQIQQAAIEYAEVIDPKRIAAHRRLCRFKAILPDFSLDYNKTITTYNNSNLARFTVGPRDWGVSLKWSLADLIWSEQQRLIDSQVRLMVKLRQDILDEVTRLYFERRRLQLELIPSGELKPEAKPDKELRIKELTALLDGLTGGYLSREISE